MSSLLEISKRAIDILGQNGFEAFVVGGFVRNMIMEIEPADIDICTNALPSETAAVFEDFRVIETGIKHGTVTVIIEGVPVEITTYRIDGKYLNHRKPENIIFTSSLLKDLKRRDFTVNAIAYCEETGYFDPFDGKGDIENRLIRCVGSAKKRFAEDALRILRALRFSSVLGFNIESETKKAIFSSYTLLSSISKERVTDEFLKLLKGDNVANILTEYRKVFMFLSGDDTSIVAQDISSSEINDVIRLSHFSNTDFLCLPSKYKKQIEFIKENASVPVSSREDILRLLNRGGEENTALLIKYLKSDNALSLFDDIISAGDCYKTEMLDISGSDMINLGFNGSEIGNTLSKVLEQVICRRLENKKDVIIDYIKKYF